MRPSRAERSKASANPSTSSGAITSCIARAVSAAAESMSRRSHSPRIPSGASAAHCVCAVRLVTSEQRDELPQPRHANQRVDDTAKRRHFAEDCGDEIESEKADETPIQSADDQKNQCDGVHN